MIKKILIILTSITIIPVLYWAIKSTYGLFYILIELPENMDGAINFQQDHRRLACEQMADTTLFLTLFFLLIAGLFMLIHNGTLSEIRKEIYGFKKQVVDFCILMIICILCLFYSYEYIGEFIIVVGGYSITMALVLAIINMVGMIKSKKKAKNTSCLKEDIV